MQVYNFLLRQQSGINSQLDVVTIQCVGHWLNDADYFYCAGFVSFAARLGCAQISHARRLTSFAPKRKLIRAEFSCTDDTTEIIRALDCIVRPSGKEFLIRSVARQRRVPTSPLRRTGR